MVRIASEVAEGPVKSKRPSFLGGILLAMYTIVLIYYYYYIILIYVYHVTQGRVKSCNFIKCYAR